MRRRDACMRLRSWSRRQALIGVTFAPSSAIPAASPAFVITNWMTVAAHWRCRCGRFAPTLASATVASTPAVRRCSHESAAGRRRHEQVDRGLGLRTGLQADRAGVHRVVAERAPVLAKQRAVACAPPMPARRGSPTGRRARRWRAARVRAIRGRLISFVRVCFTSASISCVWRSPWRVRWGRRRAGGRVRPTRA